MVPLDSFKRLGRLLAKQQESLVATVPEHERIRADLLALAARARRPHRRARMLFGVAAVFAAVGVAAYFSLSSARDLAYLVGTATTPSMTGMWISAPASEVLNLRFSDGTRASLWPEARGRVTHLGPHGADLVVEQGRASFDVVHRAEGHWQVSTGPFVVQVTGTRFDVEWQPEKDRFELELFEGHVRVSGCALGEGEDLTAGQRIEASCAKREFAISALGSKPTLSALSVERAESPGVAPEPQGESSDLHAAEAPRAVDSARKSDRAGPANLVSAASSGTSLPAATGQPWPVLARAGRFAEAYDTALNAGFDAECLARSSAELSLLADAARLSGHIDRARQAYQALRRRWPGSSGAALAAFQMGKAEFDQRRDYTEAEGWLRTYLKEQPAGEFAAPALGRLMEAEIRSGRHESGCDLAKTYLDRYPKGPYADAAHQVLDASPVVAR